MFSIKGERGVRVSGAPKKSFSSLFLADRIRLKAYEDRFTTVYPALRVVQEQ